MTIGRQTQTIAELLEAVGHSVIYQTAAAAILAGDARSVVPWIVAAGTVDHVITDPPYDAHVHGGNARTNRGRHAGGARRLAIGFDAIDPAWVAPLCYRAARRWGLAFCAIEDLGAYRAAIVGVDPKAWRRSGLWRKVAPMPQVSGDRPGQGAEGIAIWHGPGRSRWRGGGRAGVWDAMPVRPAGLHATEKPEGLIAELIGAFTDPGDLILDPFCGSGTVIAVAVRLGRRAIGIELDPAVARSAAERVKRGEAWPAGGWGRHDGPRPLLEGVR